MKKDNISETLSNINENFIEEAISYDIQATLQNRRRKKWILIAICIYCILIGGFLILHWISQPYTPEDNRSPTEEEYIYRGFFDFPSTTIPMKQYTAIYEQMASENTHFYSQKLGPHLTDSDVLSNYLGEKLENTENWYHISGHSDKEYLIQCKNHTTYSLWKFRNFQEKEHPYRDILEYIYQIDSADMISQIIVEPTNRVNREETESIKEQIGIHTITDRNEIETIYQILSTLTYQGLYIYDGDSYSTDPNDKHSLVWLERSLTLVTTNEQEIDNLYYTAVSDMFFRQSEIGYNFLTVKQANAVCKIFHIQKN